MRILAIGATGFVGNHVVTQLIDQGHNVAVLHRGETTANWPERVQDFRGDRERLRDFQANLEAFSPDVILDMIAFTEQQAQELAAIAQALKVRVVAVSSGDVYRNYDGFRGKATAPPDPVPLSEDAPLRETRFPYRGQDIAFKYADDYDKILVEQTLLSTPELPATIVRLPAVYGPGDRQHRLRPYLQPMANREDTILLEDIQANWRWSRGFVENVASALVLVVGSEHSAGRIYNLGDEPTLTEREWIEHIAAFAGWDGEVAAVPQSDLPDGLQQPVDWRYHLWTDTTAIRSDLGYVPPVSFEEAMRRTVDWEYSTLA